MVLSKMKIIVQKCKRIYLEEGLIKDFRFTFNLFYFIPIGIKFHKHCCGRKKFNLCNYI